MNGDNDFFYSVFFGPKKVAKDAPILIYAVTNNAQGAVFNRIVKIKRSWSFMIQLCLESEQAVQSFCDQRSSTHGLDQSDKIVQ
jgi:hypothetical protein